MAAVVISGAVVVSGCGSGKSGPRPVGAKVASDIATVQAGVETIQTELGLVIKNNADTADVDQLAQGADQLHSNLTDMKDQIALDAPNNTAGADLTNAVNELKNSMAALGAYTGNPNPSTLASFTNQYQQGVSDWNTAVGEIYQGTTSTPPPTLGT